MHSGRADLGNAVITDLAIAAFTDPVNAVITDLVNAVSTDLVNAVTTELANTTITDVVNAVIADVVNAVIADLIYVSFVVHNCSLLFTSMAFQCDVLFPVHVALPLVTAFAHSFEPSHSQAQM